jgi:hypothetical protein
VDDPGSVGFRQPLAYLDHVAHSLGGRQSFRFAEYVRQRRPWINSMAMKERFPSVLIS